MNLTKLNFNSLSVGLLLLFFTSCAVTILAPYDEVTDTKTTELQETIILELNRWNSIYEIKPDSIVLTYANNLDVYNQSITKTELLLSRNRGIEKNSIVIKQLEGLLENLNEMKAIHKEDNILSDADITSFKEILNVQLGAIQKFQQVRKETNK